MNLKSQVRSWKSQLVIQALVGLLVGTSSLACARKAEKVAGPSWLEAVEISVREAKPAFDDNTEVFVSIRNKTSEPVTIENLDAASPVKLERADGSTSPLHSISVGVAKPIRIPPSAAKDTSLLFQAGKSAAKRMSVYDRTFVVPASAGR